MGCVVVALLATSCVKDSLYNTPHPDKGAVIIAFEGMTTGDYVANIDGQKSDIVGSPFVYPALFAPGIYNLIVYNKAEGFIFDDGIAYVDVLADNSYAGNTHILPTPGYLYTTSQQIEIVADDTLVINSQVEKRVRDLFFEITVTQGRPELIQNVKGTLSGVAGAFDMEKSALTGDATSTVISFTREGNKLIAEVHLLGTMGAAQTMVFDIEFTDGDRTQQTEVDMTKVLAEFNGNMNTGFKVIGELETPVGMEEATAVISGWELVESDDVNAEL